jgi:hypothetical protein
MWKTRSVRPSDSTGKLMVPLALAGRLWSHLSVPLAVHDDGAIECCGSRLKFFMFSLPLCW